MLASERQVKREPRVAFSAALTGICDRCNMRRELVTVAQLQDARTARTWATLCAFCLGEAIELATGWKMRNLLSQFDGMRQGMGGREAVESRRESRQKRKLQRAKDSR